VVLVLTDAEEDDTPLEIADTLGDAPAKVAIEQVLNLLLPGRQKQFN